MKIEQLKITDFRGLSNLSLDFRDPAGKPLDLIVLAGPNGCGKTSVLEACLIAVGYGPLPEGKEKPDYNIHEKAKDFEIRLDMRNAAGVVNRITHTRKTRFNQENDAQNSLHNELHVAAIEYFSSWREPKLVGSLSITAGKRGKRPKPQTENRLWILKQSLINLTAHRAISQPQQSLPVANLEQHIFDKLNGAWKLFYPERHQRFIVGSVDDDWDKGFDLFLVDETIDLRISVDKLSSGEIEVLTMLGWFAVQKSDLDILFIDEPELHLHQSWHRVILKALRTLLPNTQIICATHSAEVLDSVDYYRRFTLLEANDPRIRLAEETATDGVCGVE